MMGESIRQIWVKKKRDYTIHEEKTKMLKICAVTAQLICVFVVAYAKILSHNTAHIDLLGLKFQMWCFECSTLMLPSLTNCGANKFSCVTFFLLVIIYS